jgi:hypothetical protein
MRAIILKQFGGYDGLVIENLADPVPKPLQSIVDKVAASVYKAKPARVFQFDEIRQAHEPMESNQANGKMVVRICVRARP